MAPCPIQRRRAVLLCSSDYDRKKFRTAACSVSPAVASYDERSSTYSAQTWVLEKQALQKKQNSEVRGQSTDRLVCSTVHDLQTGWIWTPCYTERWDQNAFWYFPVFLPTWHNLYIHVRSKERWIFHPNLITCTTSHTDIHKYTQTSPLSDKLGEFLGCQLAMFHVVVEHIKAGILLPLPKITHRHTRLLAVSRETANQHGESNKSDASRGLRIKFARVWDIFLLIVCCKHQRHSKVQGESKNETSFYHLDKKKLLKEVNESCAYGHDG